MTTLAPELAPAPVTSPAPLSVRWDRVSEARNKIREGGYDRLSDTQLDAVLQAVLQSPDRAPTASPTV